MQLNQDYRIVIPAGADELTLLAAQELSSYLGKAGLHLPTVTDASPAQEKELCIGAVNRATLPATDGLKNDGYRLLLAGERIHMVSHHSRGDLYSVFGFLEEALGYRFFTREVERIPAGPLTLDALDMTRISPFEFRETSWFDMTRAGQDYRRGLNSSHPHGTDHDPQDAYMRRAAIHYSSFGHSMYDYCSPEEFFDTHPEYFSMVDGVRIRERPQLCLTNPEVIALVSRRLRQAILDHPEYQVFSLSQMDWYNPCTCPECARVDAEEGSHAGSLIRFVNACANSIAQEFPHILIDTFAYQYTRQPPRLTRCAPNVTVRICTIECCFTHPLRSCNHISEPFCGVTDPGVTFQQDLEGWSRICDHLYVWDYTTNFRFYLAPMINLHLLQDNVRFFLENHAAGLFAQGNSSGYSGEFGELRGYLLTKLMWEPEGDYDLWMKDFLAGFYGAAGEPIYRYIHYLSDHVTRYGFHGGIYENPNHLIQNALFPRLNAFWDEAEAAVAQDSACLERVKKSRMQLRFIQLHRKGGKDDDYKALSDALIADIRHFGLNQIQEGKPLDYSLRQLATNDLPDTWNSFFNGRVPAEE